MANRAARILIFVALSQTVMRPQTIAVCV